MTALVLGLVAFVGNNKSVTLTVDGQASTVSRRSAPRWRMSLAESEVEVGERGRRHPGGRRGNLRRRQHRGGHGQAGERERGRRQFHGPHHCRNRPGTAGRTGRHRQVRPVGAADRRTGLGGSGSPSRRRRHVTHRRRRQDPQGSLHRDDHRRPAAGTRHQGPQGRQALRCRQGAGRGGHQGQGDPDRPRAGRRDRVHCVRHGRDDQLLHVQRRRKGHPRRRGRRAGQGLRDRADRRQGNQPEAGQGKGHPRTGQPEDHRGHQEAPGQGQQRQRRAAPGRRSQNASPAATGPSTRATATPAACSSAPAPGWAPAAASTPPTPTWPPRRSRSRPPKCCAATAGWGHWPACASKLGLL